MDPSVVQLGRYALYERIASGGMASVHIGRLLGPVGFARTVAIKRMHPHFSEDPKFVAMFLDEARLAARIRHPNVIPTLDVVATGGELFLVMEYVQGEALARLVAATVERGERVPPEFVTTIMAGVLHGLHAAHEAKSDRGEALDIVHRDVSPQNILVGVDGAPRVLDFGVAKAALRMQSTGQGQLKGKLAYMAPEQIRGQVGRKTDIYAASIVAWEALTGRRLFSADNEGELVDKIRAGTTDAPSLYEPGIPATVDAVVMRGLAVDPKERYDTAREMALALERALPLAPASSIGTWVEATARGALLQKSERIAAIESDSSVNIARLDAPTAPAFPPVGPLANAPETPSNGNSTEASLVLRSRLRRTNKLSAGLALGAGAILVGGIAFSMSRAGSTPAASPPAPPAPPVTAAALPAPAPTAPLPPEPSASVQSASPAPSRSTPPAPKPRAATPHASPSRAPCKLTKTLDANGEPHFSCPCAVCE